MTWREVHHLFVEEWDRAKQSGVYVKREWCAVDLNGPEAFMVRESGNSESRWSTPEAFLAWLGDRVQLAPRGRWEP